MSLGTAPGADADLRIDAAWIIPVAPGNAALPDHSLRVRAGRIVDIAPTATAQSAREVVRLPGHALIPGLVNLHTHSAMTLLRGYADDLPLMTWLNDHIWPAEKRLVGPEFVHDGSLVACAEMLRGGVTCFSDMYFFPGATADAVLETGIRAALGIIVIDFATTYAGDAESYLNQGFELRDRLRHEPRLSFTLAPHAPYSVGDNALSQVATFASQLDVPVHMHVHETRHEIEDSIEHHGVRPLARLEHLGLLGPGFIAVHAVHLLDEEIALLAHFGCHVAHCPASNLKLASGFAAVARMDAAGINLGIGTDGAASNDRLDMFSDTRLAALLAKAVANDPAALPAHRAIEMATLGGARALGLADRIGSLEPGKAADMVAVDLSAAETLPCFDPVSTLVYAAGRASVSDVWVEGRRVVANGELTTVDSDRVKRIAESWRSRVRGD